MSGLVKKDGLAECTHGIQPFLGEGTVIFRLILAETSECERAPVLSELRY